MHSVILAAAKGFQHSFALYNNRYLEDSCRAGGNICLAALYQSCQIQSALFLAHQATQGKLGFHSFWLEKAIIWLPPIWVSAYEKKKLIPDTLQPISVFLKNHLSDLCQLAALVSSVSFVFLGQPWTAIPSLAILAGGFVDRSETISPKWRHFVYQFTYPAFVLQNLLFGGRFEQLASAISLVLFLNQYLGTYRIENKSFCSQTNLTLEKAKQLLTTYCTFTVNRDFIHYNPMPSVPNIEIKELLNSFDQIEWNKKNLTTIRQKLAEDIRFVDQYKDRAEGADSKCIHHVTDEEVKAFVKDSFTACVTQIIEKNISSGAPANYETLTNYFKIITKQVVDEADPIVRTDVLFRIAVEGGRYCGPAIFDVAEELALSRTDCSFRDKIFCYFQRDRSRFWQNIYDCWVTKLSKYKLIDPLDRHYHNIFIGWYSVLSGVPGEGVKNDMTTSLSPFSALFAQFCAHYLLKFCFWPSRRPIDLVSMLQNDIGTSDLPKHEFYQFWVDWIHRQPFSEEEKEKMIEELTGQIPRLFGRQCEIQSQSSSSTKTHSQINPDLIRLMLIDIGILNSEPIPPIFNRTSFDQNIRSTQRD